jgi:hypothetical protein
MLTEHQDQASFCPYTQRVVSVHTELTFGHLRYCFGDVPPQSNSAPGNVFDMECIEALNVIRTLPSVRHIKDIIGHISLLTHIQRCSTSTKHSSNCVWRLSIRWTRIRAYYSGHQLLDAAQNSILVPPNRISKAAVRVVVSHFWLLLISHLFCTFYTALQCQTRVKLNRVFFPR